MHFRFIRFLLLALFVGLVAAGCGLPAAAPTASNVETRKDPDQPFYLVRVTGRILPFLAQVKEAGFAFARQDFGYSPSVALRPGDVVDITVFESGSTTLFGTASSAPGTQATSARSPLPSQIVEKNGRILVPYVGAVDVAGKTPIEAARLIENGLASQTIRPQVIVSLAANGANTASVNGDVNKPGPFPLTLRGERLLDAIAFAGGARYPMSETDIRLIRGRVGGTVSLQQVIDDPRSNVTVRPNDQIVAVHNPKTFTVLGATTKVAQYNFDTPRVTLAEAVARAGGPVDTIGDPGGVFLFRREATTKALSILSASEQAGSGRDAVPLVGPTTPMLYRVDMNTPDGYFQAQKIQIINGDVVLIANAEGTQLVKVLTVIRGITGIAYDLRKGAD